MTTEPSPTDIHAAATTQMAAALRTISSPVDRIFAVEHVRYNNSLLLHELAVVVREAVAEMRETMSYREIAEQLGVSRARAQQLSKEL